MRVIEITTAVNIVILLFLDLKLRKIRLQFPQADNTAITTLSIARLFDIVF